MTTTRGVRASERLLMRAALGPHLPIAALSLVTALAGACDASQLDDAFADQPAYHQAGPFCVADQFGSFVGPWANVESPQDPELGRHVVALTIEAGEAGIPTQDGHQGLVGVLDQLIATGTPATILVGRRGPDAASAALLRQHPDLFLIAPSLEPAGDWHDAQSFPLARRDGQVRRNIDVGVLADTLRDQKTAMAARGLITQPASWIFLRASNGVLQTTSTGGGDSRFLTQIHSALGAGLYFNNAVAKQDRGTACPRRADGSQPGFCSWTYNSLHRLFPQNTNLVGYCDDLYEDPNLDAATRDATCEQRWVDQVMARQLRGGTADLVLHVQTLAVTSVPDKRSVAIAALPKLIAAMTAGCSLPQPGLAPCYRFVLPTDASVFPAYAASLSRRTVTVSSDGQTVAAEGLATTDSVSHVHALPNQPADPNPPLPVGTDEHPAPPVDPTVLAERRDNDGDVFVHLELAGPLDLGATGLAIAHDPAGDVAGAASSWEIPNLAICQTTGCPFQVTVAADQRVIVEGYLGFHQASDRAWQLTIHHALGASPLVAWSVAYVRDPIAWARAELGRKEIPLAQKDSDRLSQRVLCDSLPGSDGCGDDGDASPLGMCFPDNARYSVAPGP